MKLWLKQTLVTLAVILLSVSVCLYHFVAQETDQLIQQVIQSGARDTAVFCDHLSTLERTSTAYDMDIITRQALIQYTFSTYAHLLQTGDCTWSLVMDGQYYYNTASCQPMETLPMAEDAVQPHRRAGRDAPADIRANHVGAANAADGLSRGEHRIDISTYKRFNARGAAVPAGLPAAVRRAAAADAAENARATAEIGTDFGQNRVRGI